MAKREDSKSDSSSGQVPDLSVLREKIDAVDAGILQQLNERARLVLEVGKLKEETGQPVYSAARERDLVSSLVEGNPGPFPGEAIGPVFREVISGTRSLEKKLDVGYLGPEATFSHQAALEQFGSTVNFISCGTISEVFTAVEREQVDFGVVPIENSIQGAVTETLDRFLETEVAICGELRLRITQDLMSRSGDLASVRKVVSHPQPLGQCRQWLEAHLSGIECVEASSTGSAAQQAAADSDLAAIGSPLAVETYGLKVIASSIQNQHDNTTRFLVIGRVEPPPSGQDRTSVIFTTGRDESGTLYRLLEPFHRHSVNLTSIQSRPMKGHLWEYVFFMDLEGHRSDEAVAQALSEASEISLSCRVLGSFPRSDEVLPKRSPA